jgi:hypothetical protein
MTEANDTSATLEAICAMLCDRLISEQGVQCQNPDSGFAWREGNIVFDVHNGLQDHMSE